MILNSDEEVVMSSDGNQIVLTTKRIIQENNNGTKIINLQDYVSYEITNKRVTFYLIAFIVFIIIDINLFQQRSNSNDPTSLWNLYAVASGIFTIGFLFFWLTKKQKNLLIIGSHVKIEFPSDKLSESSLNKFVQSIESLSKQSKANG